MKVIFCLCILSFNCFAFPTLKKIAKDLGLGIRSRLGTFRTDHVYESKPNSKLQLDDAAKFGKRKLPVIISFKDKVDGYFFKKIFFDFELPYKSLNQRRGEAYDKQWIYNNFLNSSERSFADSNPNWQLTGDIKTLSVVAGYQWGVLLPFKDHHRFLKMSGGFTLGYFKYQYKMSMCSSYTPTNPSSGSSDQNFGTCTDKFQIESFTHNGLGIGLTISFVLYEYMSEKWGFSFIELDYGNLVALNDNTIKDRDNIEYNIRTDFLNIDVVNLTYYF